MGAGSASYAASLCPDAPPVWRQFSSGKSWPVNARPTEVFRDDDNKPYDFIRPWHAHMEHAHNFKATFRRKLPNDLLKRDSDYCRSDTVPSLEEHDKMIDAHETRRITLMRKDHHNRGDYFKWIGDQERSHFKGLRAHNQARDPSVAYMRRVKSACGRLPSNPIFNMVQYQKERDNLLNDKSRVPPIWNGVPPHIQSRPTTRGSMGSYNAWGTSLNNIPYEHPSDQTSDRLEERLDSAPRAPSREETPSRLLFSPKIVSNEELSPRAQHRVKEERHDLELFETRLLELQTLSNEERLNKQLVTMNMNQRAPLVVPLQKKLQAAKIVNPMRPQTVPYPGPGGDMSGRSMPGSRGSVRSVAGIYQHGNRGGKSRQGTPLAPNKSLSLGIKLGKKIEERWTLEKIS
mmetsp:Transcript_40195/g.67397  ORF Transcript_40195/g.67397 Transcript_40195/m.67397 type:complete len:403 (-) Transcript_40195:113-1321(-)